LAVAGDLDSEAGIIAIAVIIALIISVISVKFYDYSFEITTALIGAFIASVGGFGLIHDYDLEDILAEILWSGFDDLTPVLIATIVLSIIGFCVQLQRLKRIGMIPRTTDEKTNFNSEQFNHAATTVSEQAKKLGQAAAPVFQNVGNQATEIWKDARTADGRAVLKEEIAKEKLLFIAPLVAFFLIPLIEKFSGYGNFYNIVVWIRNIASAISLGTLIYFILKKDRRFVFFYTLAYTCGYLLFILLNTYLLRYSFWYVLVELFNYLIIWVLLDLVSKKIKREEIKPVILLIVGVVLDTYILTWLAQFQIHLFFTFYTFIYFAVTFGMTYLLFKKRDNVSIIAFNSIKEMHTEPNASSKPSSSPTTEKEAQSAYGFCPNCGDRLTNDDPFCATCGKKIK